jgi:hypothetical protein
MRSVYHSIDKRRRLHTFELFGYDFMLDDEAKVYLIEANINPCLGVTSSFSSRFIPMLVDSTLRLALDPLFPPPPDFAASKKNTADFLPELNYELIFDQHIEAPVLDPLYQGHELPVLCMVLEAMCSRERG